MLRNAICDHAAVIHEGTIERRLDCVLKIISYWRSFLKHCLFFVTWKIDHQIISSCHMSHQVVYYHGTRRPYDLHAGRWSHPLWRQTSSLIDCVACLECRFKKVCIIKTNKYVDDRWKHLLIKSHVSFVWCALKFSNRELQYNSPSDPIVTMATKC